jgi:hypothetical protein
MSFQTSPIILVTSADAARTGLYHGVDLGPRRAAMSPKFGSHAWLLRAEPLWVPVREVLPMRMECGVDPDGTERSWVSIGGEAVPDPSDAECVVAAAENRTRIFCEGPNLGPLPAFLAPDPGLRVAHLEVQVTMEMSTLSELPGVTAEASVRRWLGRTAFRWAPRSQRAALAKSFLDAASRMSIGTGANFPVLVEQPAEVEKTRAVLSLQRNCGNGLFYAILMICGGGTRPPLAGTPLCGLVSWDEDGAAMVASGVVARLVKVETLGV